ncbi:endoglucanase 13-like [Thrips palmi]|uniref:Endoglucanase n=1 Tax=Thrips palmi TaxID=161013 RepID=A0A6P8YAH2_THRPL|nr:endoglucanase 13-like [Thrips palmi]
MHSARLLVVGVLLLALSAVGAPPPSGPLRVEEAVSIPMSTDDASSAPSSSSTASSASASSLPASSTTASSTTASSTTASITTASITTASSASASSITVSSTTASSTTASSTTASSTTASNVFDSVQAGVESFSLLRDAPSSPGGEGVHAAVTAPRSWLHRVRYSHDGSLGGSPPAPRAANNATATYDYDEVLRLSLLFYEAQRSGRLPADNRVAWRGDSALDDRGQRGEDLSGGYYDAGDFVKFSFTMASTTTLLAWGLAAYGDAYRAAGQWRQAEGAVRWAADYFIRCHVSPDELYGQVGDFSLDHRYWGRPEELNMTRPAYKIDREHPGSDLAGETAAALAAVAVVTRDSDPDYSALCLLHARQLYRFATQHRGLYHQAIKGAAQYYESTDYGDELAWAAAWLYRATKESVFLDEAEHHYTQFLLRDRPAEFFYNRKVAGVQVLLAQLTGLQEYRDAARAFCDHSVLHQKRTPKGLLYVEKSGTLCHAANIAFVCLQAADAGIQPEQYRDFARRQIHYMLGDAGRSFVVGFGRRWPTQPHHAASSCPDRPAVCDWGALARPAPNPQVLYGALVSGPDENDFYEDIRREYIYNEVTLDYNAGFQSAVAGLRQLQLRAQANETAR